MQINDSTQLSVPDIMKYHRNRYPWFFVDAVSLENGTDHVSGKKCFSYNEFFTKAVSDTSVPNFIIGEALEQTFLMTFMKNNPGLLTNTVSSECFYKKSVHIGDVLEIKAELLSFRRGIAKGKAFGFVGNEQVCEAAFVITVPEIMNNFTPKN